jgi:hypothetical protein
LFSEGGVQPSILTLGGTILLGREQSAILALSTWGKESRLPYRLVRVAEENPPIYICHVAKENPPFWSVRHVEIFNVFLNWLLAENRNICQVGKP